MLNVIMATEQVLCLKMKKLFIQHATVLVTYMQSLYDKSGIM